jgi:hypothetical protein
LVIIFRLRVPAVTAAPTVAVHAQNSQGCAFVNQLIEWEHFAAVLLGGRSMSKRIYYSEDHGHKAFDQVLLVRPKGVGTVYVYCPPTVGHGPWCEPFDSFDSAIELAALLAKQAGQPVVLLTQDAVEWWLNGLTVIGDADELRRQSD